MPDPSKEPVAGPTTTILNVDDNEANRYAVSRMLRRAGFAIVEASNGAEALRAVAGRPDLVILDVDMPDLDGFEVCRRIKADPATASIPVLHLSASYILSEDKTRGLEEGADGYLIRPVEPPELIATVRALLRVRAAERWARRTAVQWQATFDAIGDGVCLLDRDGLIVRCNRAVESMLGTEAADLIGRRLDDLIEPSLSSGDQRIGDRWFRRACDPTFDDGVEVGSVCVLTEVTDRHRLEHELRGRAEALVEDDRRKDEFLAMLAHELRNPLGPILNAFEVIRIGGLSDDEVANIRQVAERQARHLARLVDDLLDVSRITTAKIQLRREPVDLVAVIGRVVEQVRPTVESHRHRFTVEVEATPLPMIGDPTRLDQILTNLINNAAKYTEPGGSITLRAARSGEVARLEVADTGIGIPPEMLPKVFDLFTQVDHALDRSQGGLGIGLTLVRRLVELHDGTASVQSDGAGRGSVFTVELPLTDSARVEATARKPLRRVAPTRKILVVDDQMDAASVLARLLRARGHQARATGDGASALEAIAADRPDVVLLDIGLPGMNGYEIARRIKSDQDHPPILLVALTGYGQDADIRLAREAGFDHHLVKPTDLEAIEALFDHPEPAGSPDS